MDVSKNRGTPKWMVYKGKPYEQMDDLGETPIFLETPISSIRVQKFHCHVSFPGSRSFNGPSFSEFDPSKITQKNI